MSMPSGCGVAVLNTELGTYRCQAGGATLTTRPRRQASTYREGESRPGRRPRAGQEDEIMGHSGQQDSVGEHARLGGDLPLTSPATQRRCQPRQPAVTLKHPLNKGLQQCCVGALGPLGLVSVDSRTLKAHPKREWREDTHIDTEGHMSATAAAAAAAHALRPEALWCGDGVGSGSRYVRTGQVRAEVRVEMRVRVEGEVHATSQRSDRCRMGTACHGGRHRGRHRGGHGGGHRDTGRRRQHTRCGTDDVLNGDTMRRVAVR